MKYVVFMSLWPSTIKGKLREKNDLFLNDWPTFVVSTFDYQVKWLFVRTKIFHPKAEPKMQIAFPHLENCSPAQKWVSVLIYDVRTSSVIRYLRGFQLCTTFCIVYFGSFCYLYHSYNVKFWVRIRVLLRRTRSSNVFYPAVSVWTEGKHGWEGFQRWKSFWRRVHGRRRRIESKIGKFRLVCAVLFASLQFFYRSAK